MSSVVPLQDSHKQEAALCLATAFLNDPILGKHMFRQDYLKGSGAATLFASVIENQFKSGKHNSVAVNEKGAVQGVALWLGPDEPKDVPILPMLLVAPTIFGYSHIYRSIMGANAVEAKHPKYKHYYLAYVGVSPLCQGQGIGSALIKPVLQKADEEGIPCYLETGSPDNLHFYQKYGFKLTKQITVLAASEVQVGTAPVGSPLILYCMKREPIASARSRGKRSTKRSSSRKRSTKRSTGRGSRSPK